MTAPALSQHQQDALRALLQLLETEEVVALRGLAGTGKSTLIPHVANAVADPKVAAMTHKAAAVLRAKSLDNAKTFHAACMKPIFSNAYLELLAWFTAPNAPYPALLRGIDRDRAGAVVAECFPELGPEGCARALGVDSSKHIVAWEPRAHVGGTLIVDEASMATVEHVRTALEVFDRIILVGDHGQLPPVKGEPVLEIAPGVELTEIHRQAGDSPILRLAHAVRNGASLWQAGVQQIERGVDPEAGPILTWRNAPRVELSLEMRRLKGLQANRLEHGEPLICTNKDTRFQRLGFKNNTACTYVSDGVVCLDKGQRLRAPKVNIEDFTGREANFDEVGFRLGYALTAHSAQGSEWPNVQVYYEDVQALHGRGAEFRAKWLYTAITRAKESVSFFTAPIARTRIAV